MPKLLNNLVSLTQLKETKLLFFVCIAFNLNHEKSV